MTNKPLQNTHGVAKELDKTQFMGASLVAQWYRTHMSMQKAWVMPLGWEDPLEKEMATNSSILSCLGNPMER